MASSALNSGIQTLLAAEKEAADTVKTAREYRTAKLKEIKQAAQPEIARFRKGLEEEFKHAVGKDGTSEQFAKNLKKETEVEIAQIDAAFTAKKDSVVELLLGVVTTVKVEVAPDYADSLKALNTVA